jgi:2-keto-3-deoxy-L-rhamnonate aldolase RhmA
MSSEQNESGESCSVALRNPLKEKLQRDEIVLSMSVRLVTSPEIALIAKTSGFDSLYVDLEHNALSIGECSRICVAALQAGITPMVRVPSHEAEYVSRVLDMGALGVIAPHVTSAEDARKVVSCAKYPPLGRRSASGLLPHFEFRRHPTDAADAAMDAATMVVVMIESRDALDRAEEIAAVQGVDILFIGTNDLCADLGITGQLDHPSIREAYVRVIAACRAHGKHVGVGGLASRPDLMAQHAIAGARYLSLGFDLAFLVQAATERARSAREIKSQIELAGLRQKSRG